MRKFYISAALALMGLSTFAQTTTVFADAETEFVWNTWDQAHTVTTVANPLKDALNGSDKVFFFQGGPWGGMARWYNNGDVIKPEYVTVEFDVFVPVGGLTAANKAYFKIQCDNSISSAANLDKGNDVYEAGKWINVSLDISTKVASDYKQFAIQSEVANYYVDNIKFITSGTTAVNSPKSVAIQVLSLKNAVAVKGAQGQTVQVYNLGGALVYKSAAASSSETVALPLGLYVVKVGDKAVKVIVK